MQLRQEVEDCDCVVCTSDCAYITPCKKKDKGNED